MFKILKPLPKIANFSYHLPFFFTDPKIWHFLPFTALLGHQGRKQLLLPNVDADSPLPEPTSNFIILEIAQTLIFLKLDGILPEIRIHQHHQGKTWTVFL